MVGLIDVGRLQALHAEIGIVLGLLERLAPVLAEPAPEAARERAPEPKARVHGNGAPAPGDALARPACRSAPTTEVGAGSQARTCEACGRHFMPKQKGGHRPRFCSATCRGRLHAQAKRRQRQAAAKKTAARRFEAGQPVISPSLYEGRARAAEPNRDVPIADLAPLPADPGDPAWRPLNTLGRPESPEVTAALAEATALPWEGQP